MNEYGITGLLDYLYISFDHVYCYLRFFFSSEDLSFYFTPFTHGHAYLEKLGPTSAHPVFKS